MDEPRRHVLRRVGILTEYDLLTCGHWLPKSKGRVPKRRRCFRCAAELRAALGLERVVEGEG